MKQSQSPQPSLDWCLFLDVDGTLIELTETPFDTHASDALKAVLKEVSDRLNAIQSDQSPRPAEQERPPHY